MRTSQRVLAGGPLAEQLGLSRKTRHLDLWSWFGQFQLSRVPTQQNLAASLTNNLTASGLHRLLPKLRMHTRSADALALSTELGSGPAFFRSSSRSFFIGVLSLNPAMAQLTAKELEAAYCTKTSLQQELEAAYCKKSLQKELAAAYCEEESLQQGLAAAYCEAESLQQELEAAYCEETNFQQNELGAAYFLGQTKAREIQLHIAQLCQQAFADKSSQQNELEVAYLLGQTRARELNIVQLCGHNVAQDSLQQKELWGKEFEKTVDFRELLGKDLDKYNDLPELQLQQATAQQLLGKEIEKPLVLSSPTACTYKESKGSKRNFINNNFEKTQVRIDMHKSVLQLADYHPAFYLPDS